MPFVRFVNTQRDLLQNLFLRLRSMSAAESAASVNFSIKTGKMQRDAVLHANLVEILFSI